MLYIQNEGGFNYTQPRKIPALPECFVGLGSSSVFHHVGFFLSIVNSVHCALRSTSLDRSFVGQWVIGHFHSFQFVFLIFRFFVRDSILPFRCRYSAGIHFEVSLCPNSNLDKRSSFGLTDNKNDKNDNSTTTALTIDERTALSLTTIPSTLHRTRQHATNSWSNSSNAVVVLRLSVFSKRWCVGRCLCDRERERTLSLCCLQANVWMGSWTIDSFGVCMQSVVHS